MTNYDLILIPSNSASEFFRKYHRRKTLRRFLKAFKVLFTAFLTAFFVVGYSSSTARTELTMDIVHKLTSLQAIQNRYEQLTTIEVINIARLARFITNHKISEIESLKYAALIYHASQLYDLDPLDVVALITAESCFDADSINQKSGDYGLGQVNWKYWGKTNGLAPQELLDPAINIVLTCHIFKYYKEDFAKYHRGNGIKSQAYLTNIQAILSALRAKAARFKMR
jgi:soluble lytic murein transglycosylase-like protein